MLMKVKAKSIFNSIKSFIKANVPSSKIYKLCTFIHSKLIVNNMLYRHIIYITVKK